MSIEGEIIDKVSRGMLFPLVPRAAGATIRRAMFVEEGLWRELSSSEGNREWDERVGKLQADLEVFVTEQTISAKYLFLLFPKEDAVWEIRSTKENPSIRALGLLPIKDAFVSTNFTLREALVEMRGGRLVDWRSREWKNVRRMARAIWRKLFYTYQPIITVDPNEVCSGASNEVFCKERR